MEINRIRYFRTVFDLGGLRKAAELLHISPGALSKSIKVLEDELEKKLFRVSGRNIVPTDFGIKFYHLCGDTIESFDKLEKNLASQSHELSELKIGTLEVFSSYFLARFFSSRGPNASPVILLERSPGELESAILDRTVDIGLTYAPIPHPELQFKKIGYVNYKAYARKDIFTDRPLSKIPFSVPVTNFRSSPSGVKELDSWPATKKRWVKFRLELLETALQLSQLGESAIFCPSLVVHLSNQLVKAKFQLFDITHIKLPQTKKAVYLAMRSSQILTRDIQALVDNFQSIEE